ETAEAVIEFKPVEVVHKIAPRPVLFIHMGEDITVPVEESITMYEAAREPKKLVVMEGRQHYDTFKFTNPEVFEQVMVTAIDWFDQFLKTDALPDRIEMAAS